MLQVRACENTFKNGGKAFNFRSRTTAVVDYESLIKRMIQYNSTVTESDVRSVLTVFATILLRLTAQGNYVKTPFGCFYVCASGSCDSISDSFEPEKTDNDHEVDMHLRTSSQIRRELMSELEVERASNKYVVTPFISEVKNIDQASGKEKDTDYSFTQGDFISLKGTYLKTDSTDASQGVYLVSAADSSRVLKCTSFVRNTDNSVKVVLPDTADSGVYKIKIVTKPGKERYESHLFKHELKVA